MLLPSERPVDEAEALEQRGRTYTELEAAAFELAGASVQLDSLNPSAHT